MKTLDAIVYKAAESGLGVDDFVNLLINTYDIYRKEQFTSRQAMEQIGAQVEALKVEVQELKERNQLLEDARNTLDTYKPKELIKEAVNSGCTCSTLSLDPLQHSEDCAYRQMFKNGC